MIMDERRRKKKPSPLGWIILVLVLLSNLGGREAIGLILGLLIIAAFVAVPVLIIFAIIRASKGRSSTPKQRSAREPSFDDCPKPLCLHRDKGEHHVRKGKEMDPWDRPDIDISKYQRRNYLREDRKK